MYWWTAYVAAAGYDSHLVMLAYLNHEGKEGSFSFPYCLIYGMWACYSWVICTTNKDADVHFFIPDGKGKPVLWSQIWRHHTGLYWKCDEAAQAWLMPTRWSAQTAALRCLRPFCTGCESHAYLHICCVSIMILVQFMLQGAKSVCQVTPSHTFSQPLPSAPHPDILGESSSGTCGTDSQTAR